MLTVIIREDVSALLSDVNTKFAHEIKNDKKLADFFTKLQNRQAGSEEDTDSSKNKDKKADKKNKDNSSKTKNSGKSA